MSRTGIGFRKSSRRARCARRLARPSFSRGGGVGGRLLLLKERMSLIVGDLESELLFRLRVGFLRMGVFFGVRIAGN
jgi:hypothetical protein